MVDKIIFSVFVTEEQKNFQGKTKNVMGDKRKGDISCDKLIEKIRDSETLKSSTKELRAIWEPLHKAQIRLEELKDREDTDPEKVEVQKEVGNFTLKYRDKKKLLPLITVHAHFKNGRKDKDPHTYYTPNILLADIDHISKEELERVKERVKKCPYVLFACESVSGAGYHILVSVKTEGGLSDDNFKDVFAATMDFVNYDLNLSVDRSVNSISRCMFLNHDPDIFYNPDVQPLDMSGALWLKQNDYSNFNIDNEMTESERVSRYLAEADSNLNWVRGNRHNTLVPLATCCNQNGFDKELVKEWVCSKHAEPDFDDREINETVDDVYARYASDHGIKQKESFAKMDKRTNGHNSPNIHKESEEEDWDEEELLNEPCPDAEALRPYIPDGFFDYVVDAKAGPEVRFASIIGLMTACGAMMKQAECVYRNRMISPYIFMNVIGEAASGKSCINKPHKIFKIYADGVENRSREEHKKSEEELKEWKKCIKKCESDDCDCGSEPEEVKLAKIALSLNTSQNRLINQLEINNSIPVLLFAPEMDFTLNLKDMPLSTILRALFENESVSSHTLSRGDASVSRPKGSVLVAGTPTQAQRFFVNKEDGLVSRFATFFLPQSPYIPLEGYSDKVEDYDARERAIESRTLAFSNYASTHDFRLRLTVEDARLLDGFFASAEQRYAKFYGGAVDSYLRRLQDIDVRMAMVLTVFGLFKENKTSGRYDIPADIIRSIIRCNDYLIQQNIRLLTLLPEVKVGDGGKEIMYAHLYDTLPCEFASCDAEKTFEESGVSSRTARRALKKWTQTGLLIKRFQRYHKVECPEKEPLDKAETTSPCL